MSGNSRDGGAALICPGLVYTCCSFALLSHHRHLSFLSLCPPRLHDSDTTRHAYVQQVYPTCTLYVSTNVANKISYTLTVHYLQYRYTTITKQMYKQINCVKDNYKPFLQSFNVNHMKTSISDTFYIVKCRALQERPSPFQP